MRHEYDVAGGGKVTYVDHMGDDVAVVRAARVSTGSGSDDLGLIDYLMRHGHTSPFEMVELKVRVRAPIYVARQLVRYRTAAWNERSGRYAEMDLGVEDPGAWPWRAQDPHDRQSSGGVVDHDRVTFDRTDGGRVDGGHAHAEEVADVEYRARLESGVAREQARKCLPLSTLTEWYWKLSLHNWLRVVEQRCCDHAQAECRAYVEPVRAMIADLFPACYSAFVEHRFNAVRLSRSEAAWVARLLGGEKFDPAEARERGWSEGRAREFLEKLARLGVE